MALKKGGLGRGLDALFDENAAEKDGSISLRLSEIEPNRNQPRKDFDEEAVSSLADSIREHGIIEPLVVRPTAFGTYIIVAGERRFRAAHLAGLKEVPVIIKDLDEKSAAFLSMVENLQREDLNAYEEALGYKKLMDDFSLTQTEVAEKVGKSRSAVANVLRILELPKEMLDSLREGKISFGQARTILSGETKEIREKLFSLALFGASVRELEAAAKVKKTTAKKETPVKSNFYKEVELSLKNVLHRKITVKPTGKNRGTITLEFYSDDELKNFAEKLGK